MSCLNATQRDTPPELLTALGRARLKYTNPRFVYYIVWPWSELCGVFGDGPNGAYEWFIWKETERQLKTSDCGYGSMHTALRDVLNIVDPPEKEHVSDGLPQAQTEKNVNE